MSTAFLDSFRHAAEVLEETSSFLRCRCPICGGESLKMNINPKHVRYQAYMCWSNKCSTEEIRTTLGIEKTKYIYSPFRQQNNIKVFTPKEKPAYFEDNFEGSSFLRIRDYKPASSVRVKTGRTYSTKTVYSYNPYLRVLRLDKVNQDKRIYIQNWDYDRGWLSGTGDRIWPVYNSKGVILSAVNMSTADSVVFVEGEKCADYLRARGCAAFTFMASAFFGANMLNSLVVFKYFFPTIKNVLFIPDIDDAGLIKEGYVREGINKSGLGYTNLDLQKVFPYKDLKGTGADVCDLPWEPIKNAIKEKQV